MQAVSANDRVDDSKCLATDDDDLIRATSNTDVERVTQLDDVISPSAAADHDDEDLEDARRPPAAQNDDDDDGGGGGGGAYDGVVERVAPVEANVVLVSRPGDLPDDPPPPAPSPPRLRLTANHQNDNENDNDGGGGGGCGSARGPRRHRKRSSVCNSVSVDDAVVDVQQNDAGGGGQSDGQQLTSGVKRTSVSHQRHADVAGDREHRPKRKGNNVHRCRRHNGIYFL